MVRFRYRVCYRYKVVPLSSEGASNLDSERKVEGARNQLVMAAVESVEDFRKPDLDKREYRWVRLANKLEVILVSDASADKVSRLI